MRARDRNTPRAAARGPMPPPQQEPGAASVTGADTEALQCALETALRLEIQALERERGGGGKVLPPRCGFQTTGAALMILMLLC